MRLGVSVVSLSLVGAPAHADALLDAALAHGGAWSPNDWAYVSTTRVAAGGSSIVGDTWSRLTTGAREKPATRTVRVVSFDPSKPEGSRQVVLSDSSAPPTRTKRQLNLREGRNDGGMIQTDENDNLPAYEELRPLIPANAKRVADTVATATYRFQVDPKKIKHIGSADIDIDTDSALPMLTGTAVVKKTGPFAPYVSTMTIVLPTGDRGRGNAAAKVKLLSMGFRFAPEPKTGTQLLRAFGFDTSLQALGLMTVDMSALNRVDGYHYVGKK